jgi:hypothetical protein
MLQDYSRVMPVGLWSSEVAIVSHMLKVGFEWLLSGSQQETVAMLGQSIINLGAHFWLPPIVQWMGVIQKLLLLGLLIGMQISGKEILAESFLKLSDCF